MTDADPQDSNGAASGAGQQIPQDAGIDEDQAHPGAYTADKQQQNPIGAIPASPRQEPAGDPAASPAPNLTYIYAAIAAVFGILVGLAFAAYAWSPAGRTASYDLGSVIYGADGLKGHLVVNWDNKLRYRLVVEPGGPAQHAGFSLATGSPPRPLSFNIQLKDPAGSVLCGKTILLKYDPRRAAALAPSNMEPRAGTANAGKVFTDKIRQAVDIARSEALELEREHGQDIFRNDIGQDGQIESISSQGEISCSRQAFERIASWSFSPDFPTLDEQAELLKRRADVHANANPSLSAMSVATTASGARNASATRKKAKRRAPEEPATFAIEGDDVLVGYDPSRGVIETIARKTFFIDKTSAEGNGARWQDTPANIHYKCDLNSSCTLTRNGAVVLYAKLRR